MGKATSSTSLKLLPRIRVLANGMVALGPGKIELLEEVQRTGSIRAASHELGMSYMRAWKLVRVMNKCFEGPLVEVHRGGPNRGGAGLTATGREVLTLYRQMEAAALKATQTTWKRLRSRLRTA